MNNVGNDFNNVSFLSFLRKGPQVVPAKNLTPFNRIEILPANERSKVQRGYERYSGTIEYLVNQAPPTHKIAVIDGIVKITTASGAIRKESLNNWNRLSNKSFKLFTATLITGIGSAITGIVLAATGMLAVAGVVSVLAIALLVGAWKSYHAYGVASAKVLEWECPVTKAANIRKEARLHGILYIFNNRLQSYFSAEELQERWMFKMIEFKIRNRILSSVADFLIESFLKQSPLSKACFELAFPQIPQGHPLRKCVEHYESLSTRYLQIDQEFKGFVKQVERREKQLLDDIAAKVRSADDLLRRHERGNPSLNLLRKKIADVKTRALAKIAQVKESARADIRGAQEIKQHKVIAQFRPAVQKLIDNYIAIENFMQQQAQLQQSYYQPSSHQHNQQPLASAPPKLNWDNLDQQVFKINAASAPSLADLDIPEEK